jgi:hypothetical protein
MNPHICFSLQHEPFTFSRPLRIRQASQVLTSLTNRSGIGKSDADRLGCLSAQAHTSMLERARIHDS